MPLQTLVSRIYLATYFEFLFKPKKSSILLMVFNLLDYFNTLMHFC